MEGEQTVLYNEENRNGRWYGRESMTPGEADNWYADEAAAETDPPAEPTPAPQQPQYVPCTPQAPVYFQPAGANGPAYQMPYTPRPHEKKVAPAWRIVAIVSLCLLVVAGWMIRLLCTAWSDILFEADPEASYEDFFGDWSDASGADSIIPDDADMYEYFDSYFTTNDSINIPAAPNGTGVTLPFEATSGADWPLQTIYDKLAPTVVGITCYQDGMQFSWGTGVVFTADGYIITNAHVLAGSDAADVIFSDGTTYSASFLGSDTATDLAVLKIQATDLPYAEFADSNACQVGDEVVAIGNPLGEAYAGTMTDGIISAIDRSVTNKGYSMTLLQTNAALNEGNSGGPLINSHGQVIGITNMKVMFTYSATVEGIGFAIPSSVIKPVVDAIIEYGYVPGQPTLGIVAGSVSNEAMARYDLPDGIYVSSVDKNSDAYAQGLQPGDVITKMNGTPVTSVSEVNALKEGLAVGDKITCTVYREGKTFDISFKLVDKGVIE